MVYSCLNGCGGTEKVPSIKMMDGLAFLPVLDLTNGIHLLRTLCPDDSPEAGELLDYFDSTYISGRLRQQNPTYFRIILSP
jgi:hypothetical protein